MEDIKRNYGNDLQNEDGLIQEIVTVHRDMKLDQKENYRHVCYALLKKMVLKNPSTELWLIKKV